MLPIKPTHDGIFVDIIDRDVTTKDLGGGKVLHLLADDTFGLHDPMNRQVHPGIRPRWARVLTLGPDCEAGLQIGDLVLCEYGKWSRGFPLGRDGLEIVRIWRIKESDILMLNPDSPGDEFVKEWQGKLARLSLTLGHY